MASRLGTTAPVVTIPTGLDLVRAPVGPDERRAARSALGLAGATTPIVRSVGTGLDEPILLRAVDAVGGHWIDRGADPDLARAAADVVAAPTAGPRGRPVDCCSPPTPEVPSVAPDEGALAGLVDSDTGARCGADEHSIRIALSSLSDPDRRAAAGAAASDRVVRRFGVAPIGERWIDLLSGVADAPGSTGGTGPST